MLVSRDVYFAKDEDYPTGRINKQTDNIKVMYLNKNCTPKISVNGALVKIMINQIKNECWYMINGILFFFGQK